jgi:hypothetical protein
VRFLEYNIPKGSVVLEIGCGTGFLLGNLSGIKGIGIDISEKMIEVAKRNYPNTTFICDDAEELTFKGKVDFIVISDTLGYLEDIQKVFRSLKKNCTKSTRIILTYHNFLWTPVLRFAEWTHMKMPQRRLNWLNARDISNLLEIENFDIVRRGRRLLFPKYVPLVSSFCNRLLANLPVLNALCLTGYIVARDDDMKRASQSLKVSVVVPARNEKGNVESAVQRVPEMGSGTEIIFVEGNSKDGTYEEILRVAKKYKGRKIRLLKQDGRGKGDAVRKGFAIAEGDILMILDADLTVAPEELLKFYRVIADGIGEFINGCRLVYPMEREAMQLLNIIANKVFSLLFTWLIGQPIKDTLCGTKVISKENWIKLSENRGYFGDFDPFGDFDLLFGSSKLNLKIIEIPIRYRARKYGETNISRFKHGWLLLRMVLFAVRKIKFV